MNFADVGTKWTKASNLVQLFLIAYKIISGEEPLYNTSLTLIGANFNVAICKTN